jgi:hypothetical protein
VQGRGSSRGLAPRPNKTEQASSRMTKSQVFPYLPRNAPQKSRQHSSPQPPAVTKNQTSSCPPWPSRTKRRSHSNIDQNWRAAEHRPPVPGRFVRARQGGQH